MNRIREMQCALLLLGTGLLLGCAAKPKERPRDAILPEIDVLQMKENSDVALRMAQQNQQDIEALAARVSLLEQKTAGLAGSAQGSDSLQWKAIRISLDSLGQELQAMRLATAALTVPKPAQQASAPARPTKPQPRPAPVPVLRTASSQAPSGAPEQLLQALQLFDQGKYAKAAPLLESVARTTPATSWTDDAWYWLGESLYRTGNFQAAAVAFQNVLAYVDGDRRDDAQFLLAGCYAKLGDRTRALTEYQKLEQTYPESEHVPRARAEARK